MGIRPAQHRGGGDRSGDDPIRRQVDADGREARRHILRPRGRHVREHGAGMARHLQRAHGSRCARDGSARREQHPVEVEHDARGGHAPAGGWPRESRARAAAATRRGRRCARPRARDSGHAGRRAPPASPGPPHPRCRRRCCRPPSPPPPASRRRAPVRLRRSWRKACGGRERARRARSPRRSRAARRTARARDRCWRPAPPCSRSRAGRRAGARRRGTARSCPGRPRPLPQPRRSARPLPAPLPCRARSRRRSAGAVHCGARACRPEDVQRIQTGLLVAIGVEPGAEAGAELGVAARVEDAAWTDQREIDVEQNELRPRAHRPGP